MEKKRKLLIAAAALLAVAIGLGAYAYHSYQVKVKKYAAAAEIFESGKYEEAAKAFEPLGGFRHADDVAKTATVFKNLDEGKTSEAVKVAEDISDFKLKDEKLQKAIDDKKEAYYQAAELLVNSGLYDQACQTYKCLGKYKDSADAAIYCEAQDKIENDDMKGAIPLLEKIAGYKDAASLKENCSTYLEAAELQDKGDDESLKKAEEMFNGLGEFKDSSDRALACKSVGLFKEAKALADKKDYDGAYKILKEYPSNPYPGWKELMTESKNEIDYAEAEKYFKDEHYYKAYQIYNRLGDFKNSKDKAKKCKRDNPGNKILFQDPDYKSSSVKLTIDNKGYMNTYIKLYSSSDKLAARIFIKEDGAISINLPAGTYHMNRAYGKQWYGKKDMFGDEGFYWKCKIGNSYNFVLKSGYIYTLKAGGSGDAVSNESTGAGDF